MGKRGRPKTPTPILIARQSWRAKTRTGEPEVKEPIPVPPPEWLTNDDAVECWNRLRPLLGWVRLTDGNIFARYCETWGVYRQRCMERAGAVMMDHKESLDARIAKLAELLLRMEAQIGLTPSARANVRVEEKPKDSKKIQLLQGKRKEA